MQNIPTISIVDDDHLVREATADLISSLGLNAKTFASAEEFLLSDESDKTSCLITDLEMPGVNGLELQKRLLRAGRRIPIIFITAYPQEAARVQALTAGAVAFLTKPFEDAFLVKSLELALRTTALDRA